MALWKSVGESFAPRAAYAGDYDPFKRAFRKNLSAEQLASFMREKFHRTERDIFSSAFYRFCFPLLFYGGGVFYVRAIAVYSKLLTFYRVVSFADL